MYFACRRPQAATLVFRCGVTRSTFSCLEKASWRTRRMARRKRNVSDLPYAASPLSCVAFFVNEQKGRIEIGSGKGNAAGSTLYLE